MKPRRTPFLRILAALALVLFAGDISADSIADLIDAHCVEQTSQSAPDHEKSPCSHCSCATHTGAVVVADFALRVGVEVTPTARLLGDENPDPTRLAGSIDHPPQLA
ncbi:MAG: hypothetical protein ABI233_12540 [Chthoniobacterales bacterium]